MISSLNVHENEDNSLDAMLQFNGDFDDSSTLCRESGYRYGKAAGRPAAFSCNKKARMIGLMIF